jgi:hypothetical protein
MRWMHARYARMHGLPCVGTAGSELLLLTTGTDRIHGQLMGTRTGYW